jgi:outer membrane receptor protein involved in Fe transport
MALSYRILAPLTLSASAAYTDARLTSSAKVLGITNTGARLPLSPRINFALMSTYNFNIIDSYTGAVTITDRYVGGRNAGFGTRVSPLYSLGSYNTTDLNLAIYAPHGLEADLFLKNVFDKAGEVSATTLANQYNPAAPVPVYISQPRTVGVALKVKFH